MLTGYPKIETTHEAIELGASEYCVKFIDKTGLAPKVFAVLTQ